MSVDIDELSQGTFKNNKRINKRLIGVLIMFPLEINT